MKPLPWDSVSATKREKFQFENSQQIYFGKCDFSFLFKIIYFLKVRNIHISTIYVCLDDN